MNKKILALIDYKGRFGSKHNDFPYRSGMDKSKLTKYFESNGYILQFEFINNINLNSNKYRDDYIIYTSSEDIGYSYKVFIEDAIYSLELADFKIIPSYKYLHANNNKVFMENLRKLQLPNSLLKSFCFGSIKDLDHNTEKIQYPCVLKTSEGASGKGVFLIKNKKRLLKKIKKISNHISIKEDIKDYLRSIKHKNYIKESIYRKKFIIQELIPNLKNDWKIYIFGDKLYIFNRPILKGRGIKASGGGYHNYFYGLEAKAPEGMFDFAQKIYEQLNVPHVSLDIAFDGKQFFLIEFQAIYFGTAGIIHSDGYFTKQNNKWVFCEEKHEIEKVYADSIDYYICQK